MSAMKWSTQRASDLVRTRPYDPILEHRSGRIRPEIVIDEGAQARQAQLRREFYERASQAIQAGSH